MSDRTSIANIRAHMHALGYDLSHLTDEQIEAGAVQIGQQLAATGLSMRDTAANLLAAIQAAN